MDIVDLGKVGLDGNSSDAVFLDCLDGRHSGLLARGVVDDDIGPELSKPFGDGLADTAARTGHQSGLT
jgi:hypothetical protein